MLRKGSSANSFMLWAMATALASLFLYIGFIWSFSRIPMYLLGVSCMFIPVAENRFGAALLAFTAASAVIGFMVSWEYIAPFIVLPGHYGVFKVWLEKKYEDKSSRVFFKLVYCNFFVTLLVYLAGALFQIKLELPVDLPDWGQVLILQPIYLVLDLVFAFCIRIYKESIRRFLFPE